MNYLTGVVDKIKSLKKVNQTFIVAIDGRGGSGKSTLAEELKQHLELDNVSIVHLDDFAYPMRVADMRRLLDHVILPLKENKFVKYKKRNFESKELSASWEEIDPGGIVIIEGVIALHDILEKFYDFKIWVEASAEFGYQRGVARDMHRYGIDTAKQWLEEWIPKEDKAIKEQQPQEKADIVINAEESLV